MGTEKEGKRDAGKMEVEADSMPKVAGDAEGTGGSSGFAHSGTAGLAVFRCYVQEGTGSLWGSGSIPRKRFPLETLLSVSAPPSECQTLLLAQMKRNFDHCTFCMRYNLGLSPTTDHMFQGGLKFEVSAKTLAREKQKANLS